jgi:hypothetical protein
MNRNPPAFFLYTEMGNSLFYLGGTFFSAVPVYIPGLLQPLLFVVGKFPNTRTYLKYENF